MRLIDDWLLITTNFVKAHKFYDMVSQGMLTIGPLMFIVFKAPSRSP